MPKDFGGGAKKSFGKSNGNLKSKPVDLKKPFEKKPFDSKPKSFAKPENKTVNANKSSDDSEEKKRKREVEGEAEPTAFTYDGISTCNHF
jgi:hypothetical protein